MLLKDLDEIVFVDTDTFINIEKHKMTRAAKDAIALLLSLPSENNLFVSDLSVVELILGCRSIADLYKLYKELVDLEYSIFGRCDDIKNLLEQDVMESVINSDGLDEYKLKLKTLRDNYCFIYFENMFYTFLALFMIILLSNEEEFWKLAFFGIFEFLNKNREIASDILKETYIQFIEMKKERKTLISSSVEGLLISVLPRINKIYDADTIKNHLSKIDIKKDYKKISKNINIKNDGSFTENMMKYLASASKIDDRVNEIAKEAINYKTIQMIVLGAKFNPHDLIDVYNISNLGSDECIIHYFCDDAHWNDFISIERNINPKYFKATLMFNH